MTDATILSHFVSSMNMNVFLKEFSFSRTRFTPNSGTERELADHVVKVGPLLFLYQLKDRDISASGNIERWLERKVVNKATRQMRDTLAYLAGEPHVQICNERGHTFDISVGPGDSVFKLIVFKCGERRTRAPYPRHHMSRTSGFIHIVDFFDYVGICRYLITPAEIAEYLIWRESVFRTHRNADSVSESALVGQFILDKLDVAPSEQFVGALAALDKNRGAFDLANVFAEMGQRIEYTIGEDGETSYYPILSVFAQLNRLELSLFKERLLCAIDAADKLEFIRPWRFVCPGIDCGILVMAVPPDSYDQRLTGLQNFCTAAKYDQRTTRQVGVAVSRRDPGSWLIDWAYLESDWHEDADVEKWLMEKNPFRPLKTARKPRYVFRTEELEAEGLADSTMD